MKLRTSFFDWTVLKKDLLRFAPVWAVYLILGMLVQSAALGTFPFHMSEDLADAIGGFMSGVNCVYGIVTALLLFGDLFNSRLCNALHAMPLRRETWFVTHFVAGILFSLLPNLVLALLFMPQMGGLWFTALIWLGGSTLSYLFFFGTATLAALSTGSRFGALTVYGLLNFAAMEVYWVLNTLIMPMLYGVRISLDGFAPFSPLIALNTSREAYYHLRHACPAGSGCVMDRSCVYVFDGFGGNWGYLFLLAGVGLVLAGLALWLYRRRNLECAGDFAAIRPVKWAVTIFGSIGCGMVFRIFGFNGDLLALAFLFVGIAVGFFLLQMILSRKVKVFGRKNWIRLGALVLAVVLLLVLGAVDILGIEKRIPKTSQVEKVVLADGNWSETEMERIVSGTWHSEEYIVLSQPEDIDTIRQAHREMLENVPNDGPYRYITLCYYLKSGGKVLRNYRMDPASNTFAHLKDYFRGEYVFGVSSPEVILQGLKQVEWNGIPLETEDAKTLVRKLWADAEAGLLMPNRKNDAGWITSVYLSWEEGGKGRERYLTVGSDAVNSWPFLEEQARKLNLALPEWAWQ